jgi:hypothetical protein
MLANLTGGGGCDSGQKEGKIIKSNQWNFGLF